MEIKDLFLSIFDILSGLYLFDDYEIILSSSHIDLIPNNGSFGDSVLRGLCGLNVCMYISTNETSIYARLTPRDI